MREDRSRSAGLPQESPSSTKDWNPQALTETINHVGTSDASSWNTRKLGLRIGADVAAASAAGFLVAPVITLIDRGIIENASGRNTLGGSLKSSFKELLFRPQRFVFSKPFALIFSLYFGTYMAANSIDSAFSTIRAQSASTVTAGLPKFAATSTTNLSLCLYKDSRFTQMFGAANAAPRPVPTATFALFALRDSLTIFASFNLPALVAPHLSQRMGESLQRYISSASAAQIMTPAALQVVSTPLHLLGLDLYNRERAEWRERAVKVTKDWAKSSLARMGRIVPAFGIGGVVNTRVRSGLMKRLE
ncbi:uncharacterized protein BDZ99DRAFT_466596 [Mytilinidion resinicola]|uniref:Sequence orphan n=1 Tax=Mytilinidion resinicola TaxID=574789 RepID=A0A6A6Y9Z8_9PEZI|nr:uncharacterized protein BDZ99DRAFT_466596 [Mytilinidion resinicola]KAF2805641.1 hypothetical protein BDZ99DRAFT_466596 [Mytilinidion resinicola]